MIARELRWRIIAADGLPEVEGRFKLFLVSGPTVDGTGWWESAFFQDGKWWEEDAEGKLEVLGVAAWADPEEALP